MSPAAPTVSVVVPVRDGAATLARCLAAAQAALPTGGELIVVDDGSVDGSGEIARQAGARVLHHAHSRGTSAARNAGWRAARADRIAFVDADVVLAPTALRSMQALLDQDPGLRAVNGLYALAPLPSGRVTAFTNTSIVYQHLGHGRRVSSAFTGLCLFRRETLEQLGGWDERWGARYADDVFTRYVLPPNSIALDEQARGLHLKTVPLPGLLRHRFNVGWHYLRSVRSYWPEVSQRPALSVLSLRYPANTVLALAWLGGLASCPVLPLVGGPILVLCLVGSVTVNARFAYFTLRHRGPVEAALALPLSVLEGGAYLAGLAGSALHQLRHGLPEPASETT